MLSFRQMEVFRSVMLCGSISAAAQQLGVAQPTVTNTIRRLEDVLGVSLFDRSGSRLRPTLMAQQIFEVMTPTMSALEQLSDKVQEVARGEHATFRLGVSPSVSHVLAPRTLSKFAARRPGTGLRMDTLSLRQIRDYLWLAEGNCAVTIFPVDDPMIASRECFSISMVCTVPEDHPLAGRDAITIHDIADEPLVFFHPDTPHGRLVKEMFHENGITPNIAIETRFAETAPSLMREGFGIALVDELTGLGVRRPDVKVLPLADVPRLPVLLHSRSDQAGEPDVNILHECLMEAAVELGFSPR